MPGANGVNVEPSCEALCRTLVSQNGLQRETADISQSVLYTSLMGLLLVADNEVCQQKIIIKHFFELSQKYMENTASHVFKHMSALLDF